MFAAPILAQFRQQLRRKDGVPILRALALFDANLSAVTVDVLQAQPARLTDPQPGRVDRQQQRAMFAVHPGDTKQPADLLLTVDAGLQDRLLHPRQALLDAAGRAVEDMPVEATQGAHRDGHGAHRQFALSDQMEQIPLQLVVANVVRRTMIVPRQLGDRADIDFLRLRGEPANLHLIDELLTEDGHNPRSLTGPPRHADA